VRLDQKIRTLDQATQQIAAGVALEVERDRALVAIVRPPIQRAVGMRRVLVERPDTARRRAAWRLDFDHVGAQVGQHLAAQQAALGREIEHAIWTQHRHEISAPLDS